MKDYPVEATERFDDAKFHRKYCMSFVKKFIHGNVLEVGAGCGSFTRDYIDNKMNATLTETDNKNFEDLKKNFINNKNIKRINLCGVKGVAGISWIKKNGPSINTGPFKF